MLHSRRIERQEPRPHVAEPESERAITTPRGPESQFTPRTKAVIFGVTVAAVLYLVTLVPSVLAPFIWALVTAYIFQPVINGFERVLPLPRRIIAAALFFVLFFSLGLVLGAAIPILRRQAIELVNQAPRMIEAVDVQLRSRSPVIAARFDIDSTALQRAVTDVTNQWTQAAPRRALSVVQQLFAFLLEFFVYLVATFYFMLQGDRIYTAARRLVPARYHRESDRLVAEINRTLGGYLRGQVLLVGIMSSATYVALSIYEVRYAGVLAVATGLLELIPILGPWSAGTIAVSVAALQPTTPFGWSNLTLAIVVGLTYFALRQLEDTLVIPTLIGRIVNLHPLVMIFTLLAGTSLGGVLGLFLAVPAAAVLKIVGAYLFEKLTYTDEPVIRIVGSPTELREAVSELIREHASVVFVVQPGAVSWDDLEYIRRLVHECALIGAKLRFVTSDSIAANLALATGIPVELAPAQPNADGFPMRVAR